MARPPAGRTWPLRLWHTYLGMLIAPSIIFFGLTGALQMLNLHESHVGYHAPAVLVQAASLHKDQRLPSAGERARSDRPAPHYSLWQAMLKAYWIGVALALVGSTILGIILSLRNRLHRRRSAVLLVIGAVIPIALALA